MVAEQVPSERSRPYNGRYPQQQLLAQQFLRYTWNQVAHMTHETIVLLSCRHTLDGFSLVLIIDFASQFPTVSENQRKSALPASIKNRVLDLAVGNPPL